MRFSKALLLVFAVQALLIISGCSSLPYLSNDEQSSPKVDAEKVPSKNTIIETPIETLTPLQQKIADLQAQPNLYLSSAPQVSENIKQRYQQALQARQSHNIKDATNLLTQLTIDKPSMSGPWLQLGDLQLTAEVPNSEQIKQAQQYYQRAVEANMHNYHAQNRLATLYRKQGQFEQAEQHYLQAIRSWPAFAQGYLNLGILNDLYKGNKTQALEYYTIYQALQDKPDRQVKGWIADLNRQLNQQAQE